jgi:hypothetical protein
MEHVIALKYVMVIQMFVLMTNSIQKVIFVVKRELSVTKKKYALVIQLIVQKMNLPLKEHFAV